MNKEETKILLDKIEEHNDAIHKGNKLKTEMIKIANEKLNILYLKRADYDKDKISLTKSELKKLDGDIENWNEFKNRHIGEFQFDIDLDEVDIIPEEDKQNE